MTDLKGSPRIFKTRLVNEVKGKETDQPYEKTRVVVKGFNDQEKTSLLTQAPTVQRMSQRLLLALASTLMSQMGFVLWIRDISQAYTHATTKLTREIFASIPRELQHRYPPNTVIRIVKPLYGISESGNHWWATYSAHHANQLKMTPSTFDPCLMTTRPEDEAVGLVAIQTDATLGLTNAALGAREEEELAKANLPAKARTEVSSTNPTATFNGCTITLDGDQLRIQPKGQEAALALVEPDLPSFRTDYRAQRARGAYLAMICQPEAQFDLAIAAQATEPGTTEARKLNARLQWQKDNAQRGLLYRTLDLSTTRLYVFVDASFANNDDMTSQIGYVVVLGNEEVCTEDTRAITGNVIHWSSTKCKRITRSVLASEIYAMSAGIDTGIALSTTLDQICQLINKPRFPLVLCTDSFSLYECLVKLGTTKEKRLMIDIMGIRQAYERREVDEIRWIEGNSNPADAMTKAGPNRALTNLIDGSTLTMKMQGWVQR